MFADFVKNYLVKIKNVSIFLAVFFIISVFLGYALAHNYPEQTKKIIYDSLKSVIEPAKDYTSFRLFEFIFFKNAVVALVSVLLGIIFGIIPILIIFINGLTLGVVGYIALGQFNIAVFLAGILPHGIIEIPALIFSAASGIRLWRSIWRRLFYDEKTLTKEFLSVLKFFMFVILPMLAIAAMIEAFVTPYILDLAINLF